jgi:hypothetical protein
VWRAVIVVVTVLGLTAGAAAETLRAVVRVAGKADKEAVRRLRGQIVDLDVEAVEVAGALEKSLDAQIVAAGELAVEHEARAVVWFVPGDDGLSVVVATPDERRVFVRELATGDASADAEAAALAARSALRAIALGGTIGVEVPPDVEPEPDVREPDVGRKLPVPGPGPGPRWVVAAGWAGARDGGADGGAHGVRLAVDITNGRLTLGAELSVGVPARRDDEIAVDLSRSAAALAAGYARGPVRATLGAGVALYRRATVEVPDDLEATPSAYDAALLVAPSVAWRVALSGRVGLELAGGVDVVVGGPELIVDRGGGMTEILAEIETLQPRVGVALTVELR